MKIYEAVLEYIRLREHEPEYGLSEAYPNQTYSIAHRIVDLLSDSELKQECAVDAPLEYLRTHLDEPSVHAILTELIGIDDTDRSDLVDGEKMAEQLPKNCSIPFAFATGGRMDEARDLMLFLLDNGVASESISHELLEEYKQKYGGRTPVLYDDQLGLPNSFAVKAVERPSSPVRQVLDDVVEWAECSFDGPQVFQVEMPVGAQRIANTGNASINTDRSVRDVLEPTGQTDRPAGFPFEKGIAEKAGARTVAGCVKSDFVLVNQDTVYVGEIKSSREEINGQQDFYKPLGQALDYAVRFSEDYPTIASECDVYPMIATRTIGVDIADIRPSLQAHGVGLFNGRWLVRPSGAFDPPSRSYLNKSDGFPQ